MYDITAVGELLIDFTPEQVSGIDKPLFSQNPGGAPGNVMAAAATLGVKTCLISRVGDDAFGTFLIDQIRARGVNTDHIGRDNTCPTTLAFVHLDRDGDRSFSFYRKPGADILLDVPHIPGDIIAQSRVFHFGSVSMTAQPARAATLHALTLARQAGALISYDPNYRPSLWESETEAIQVMTGVLPQVDILKISQEELPLLTGTDDLERGSLLLQNMGITLVLISRGAKGAFYRLGDLWGSLATYEVDTIDTTGAGDAFLGAVLSHLCHMTREEIAELSREAIEEIVDFANAAGSLTTTRKGAIAVMPTGDEIAELRRGKD